MKNKALLIIALVMASFTCSAEVIDGPANVRTSPNGQVSFSLNDKIPVDAYQINADWYKISLLAYVDAKTGFANPKSPTLKKGVDMFDEQGSKIGKTMDTVKNCSFFEEGINTGRKIVQIEGTTHRKNIRGDSILELQLSTILKESKTLSIDDFRAHMKAFEYEEWSQEQGFSNFIQMSGVTEPGPRAILFFHNGQFVAVYHWRPIVSNKIAASTKIQGGTMSYVKTIVPELREKLSAIYYPMLENAN
ncbi:MAG: hypothetical protein CVV41_05795 [Candidatus Riflebacteria bacterium HGW-Riflebacteria-1]|jgi:hypothetical protein|nr:MAG: hypothetical protein CVV41_05795 [Candidatus Riflebacteria bacterium HGW-Riflebacteria-1]